MYYKVYVKESYEAIDMSEDYPYRIIEIEGSNLKEIIELIFENSVFFKEHKIKNTEIKSDNLVESDIKIIDISNDEKIFLYGTIEKIKNNTKRKTKVIQSTDWI